MLFVFRFDTMVKIKGNMDKELIDKIYKTQDKITKDFASNVLRVFTMLNPSKTEDISKGQFYPVKANGKTYLIIDGKLNKIVMGEDYNYIFSKENGQFARWGKSFKEDPDFSPIGGEILDIEVTTICHGIRGHVCDFCYKSNTPNGKNMSFDTFKGIIDKMGKQLTQVAFGADSTATSNPDLFKMAAYCRELGVVPNITVAKVSDDIADKLVNVMGAVAVSCYNEKDDCYNSIKKLTDRGMSQINLHFMLCEETFGHCISVLQDIKVDERLTNLNAIVFLALKQKGRGVKYHTITQEHYNDIVQLCLKNDINFGMDSCSAVRFLDAIKNNPNYEQYKVVVEPCESTNFSQYIDVNGFFYPCSFCEKINGWEAGLDVTKCENFLTDVWYHDRVVSFRNKLNNNCNNCHKARECPIYKV